MTEARRAQRKLERIEARPAVGSPSLEAAFISLERPAPRYADAPETRAISPRTAQDGR